MPTNVELEPHSHLIGRQDLLSMFYYLGDRKHSFKFEFVVGLQIAFDTESLLKIMTSNIYFTFVKDNSSRFSADAC